MLAKTNLVPVPYKGGAPLVIDVMGGHVELGIAGLATLQGEVRSGRLRLLGIASLTPSSIFPDAPLIPRDVPGFDVLAWWGIFAPAGTPSTNGCVLLDWTRRPTERTHCGAPRLR
jgi:tripartite-type tricarboxylate transporter receptor subunit TctC